MSDAPLIQLHALVAHRLGRGPEPALDAVAFQAPCTMVFTTFTVDGELRGCVGCPGPTVGEAARRALEATLEDARFAPLRPEELPRLRLSLSILPPDALEPVMDPREITLGTHGVKVSRDGLGAMFLPQVAQHAGWRTPEEMLDACCRKAGLPLHAWREGGRVWRFTVRCLADPGAA